MSRSHLLPLKSLPPLVLICGMPRVVIMLIYKIFGILVLSAVDQLIIIIVMTKAFLLVNIGLIVALYLLRLISLKTFRPTIFVLF
jgi:hypothetical protein